MISIFRPIKRSYRLGQSKPAFAVLTRRHSRKEQAAIEEREQSYQAASRHSTHPTQSTASKTSASEAPTGETWQARFERCFSQTLGLSGRGVTNGAPVTNRVLLVVLCERSCHLIAEASRQQLEGWEWESGRGWCP